MNHGGARRKQSVLLLPTDFQEPSGRALLHGIKLATALGLSSLCCMSSRRRRIHPTRYPTVALCERF
jgi:hypothetical protein